MPKRRTPIFASMLLKLLLRTEDRDEIFGDYSEEYFYLLETRGRIKAAKYFWVLILVSLPSFFKFDLFWRFNMFKNYMKTSLRNIAKYKTFSVINISGLAIGLTCCILIYMYIADELSFDNFHKNSGRLYRVLTEWYQKDGSTAGNSYNPTVMGSVIKDDFPEAEIHLIHLLLKTQ